MYIPSKEQNSKINELKKNGYSFNKPLSVSCCAVVLQKNTDYWIFDFDGGIEQNPAQLGHLFGRTPMK